MPHSPFTRFLALAIVAAHAVILLWPDPRVQAIGQYLVVVLPFLLMLFTWSAVRDAPVFNDHAFHRTLPTDDAQVFRRTLRIHGAILLGIALVVVVYCLLFNLGWQVMSYGVLMMTVPVWAFMAVCGIATTASTTTHGKSWAYVAMFGVPALSAMALYNLRDGFSAETDIHSQSYYLDQLRAIPLAGAILLPLCWWLIAARRRRMPGLVLGMVICALMPWIYIYGGYIGNVREGEGELIKPAVTLLRKAVAPDGGKWIRAENLFQVEGLREGQYLDLQRITYGDGMTLNTHEVVEDSESTEPGAYDRRLMMGRFGGGDIQWGRQAIWNHLRKQVPPHETFGHWDPKMSVRTHPALLKQKETAPLLGTANWVFSTPKTIRQPYNVDPLASPWGSAWGDIYEMEKVGVVDVEKGGSCRLRDGGIIRVKGLEQVDGEYELLIRRYVGVLDMVNGPWFESKAKAYIRGYSDPWVIAVDETGRHAFILGPFYERGGERDLMLCRVDQWACGLGGASNAEKRARLEMLRKCRLHIFQQKWVGSFNQTTVPQLHD